MKRKRIRSQAVGTGMKIKSKNKIRKEKKRDLQYVCLCIKDIEKCKEKDGHRYRLIERYKDRSMVRMDEI